MVFDFYRVSQNRMSFRGLSFWGFVNDEGRWSDGLKLLLIFTIYFVSFEVRCSPVVNLFFIFLFIPEKDFLLFPLTIHRERRPNDIDIDFVCSCIWAYSGWILNKYYRQFFVSLYYRPYSKQTRPMKSFFWSAIKLGGQNFFERPRKIFPVL